MMDEENIDKSLALIEQLGVLAVEHDAVCEDAAEHADGCSHSKCLNNRWIMVAQLMVEMGMDLSDLGFVAEAYMDIVTEDSEDAAAPVVPTENDVLDAGEIL